MRSNGSLGNAAVGIVWTRGLWGYDQLDGGRRRRVRMDDHVGRGTPGQLRSRLGYAGGWVWRFMTSTIAGASRPIFPAAVPCQRERDQYNKCDEKKGKNDSHWTARGLLGVGRQRR